MIYGLEDISMIKPYTNMKEDSSNLRVIEQGGKNIEQGTRNIK